MLSARTLSLIAPFVLISFATSPAKAQHFSKPLRSYPFLGPFAG